MEKKSHWGRAIAAVYLLFMFTAIAFVFFSRFHQMDLVTEDYYNEELNYQQHIERSERSLALPAAFKWEYAQAAKMVILRFPGDLVAKGISGHVLFFRPSDAKQDQLISLQLSEEGFALVNVAQLSSGLWRMKVFWNVGGEEYYNEDVLQIE